MMYDLEIDIRANADTSWDLPQDISIRSGAICFTELVRNGDKGPDQYLNAPPVQLAFWITDNWWRLRWEPVVSDSIEPSWRLAHELSAIGGGHLWPCLRIWGEGRRVGLACRSDPPNMNFALRFTKDALAYACADKFEQSVDCFLNEAIDSTSNHKAALTAQVSALNEERCDPDAAAWRRLEARLGFGVDGAPDELIETLFRIAELYGQGGVEEAVVASQGTMAADALKQGIEVAKGSSVVCRLQDAVAAAGDIGRESNKPIWRMAEEAASAVRQGLGVQEGPLRNTRLAELLNTSKVHFRAGEPEATGVGYGLRLRESDGENNVIALSTHEPQARRFELCRALGDAIWLGNDTMGPMTRTKTERQKFQRAFAQGLLCPYDDLLAYINSDKPTEEDVLATAHHFHVSEKVIQTTLINKGVIGRTQFAEMVEAA